MDISDLVTRARNLFTDQLLAFIDEQRKSGSPGSGEVKLRLSDTSLLFDRLYCADFVKNDGQPEIVELQPERMLSLEPIPGSFGAASFVMEQLHWHDVVLHHDAHALPQDTLAGWFRRWFDPDNERNESSAELANVVHSLLVQPNSLGVDFGSAAPDAFWNLLDLIETAGATTIRVSSSPVETDAA